MDEKVVIPQMFIELSYVKHSVLSVPALITESSYLPDEHPESWRSEGACVRSQSVSVWPGWGVNPSLAVSEALLLFLSYWMWGVILGLSLLSISLWANSHCIKALVLLQLVLLA